MWKKLFKWWVGLFAILTSCVWKFINSTKEKLCGISQKWFCREIVDPFDETKRMFKEGFMCAKSPFKVSRRLILPNPILSVSFWKFGYKSNFWFSTTFLLTPKWVSFEESAQTGTSPVLHFWVSHLSHTQTKILLRKRNPQIACKMGRSRQ